MTSLKEQEDDKIIRDLTNQPGGSNYVGIRMKALRDERNALKCALNDALEFIPLLEANRILESLHLECHAALSSLASREAPVGWKQVGVEYLKRSMYLLEKENVKLKEALNWYATAWSTLDCDGRTPASYDNGEVAQETLLDVKNGKLDCIEY